MHCTILCLGSRGDVQPLIDLGTGLKAAGYSVRCVAPEDFEGSIRERKLEYVQGVGRANDFYGGKAAVHLRDSTHDGKKMKRLLERYLKSMYMNAMSTFWDACQGTDFILSFSWNTSATTLAEVLQVPVFLAMNHPPPHLPTESFSNPFHKAAQMEPKAERRERIRQSWQSADSVVTAGLAILNEWREKQGLVPKRAEEELSDLRALPQLVGFSPSLVPKPPDWGPHVHVTGYWYRPKASEYLPPAQLQRFLDEGEAPIAIGFSSQISGNPQQINENVMEGVKRSGRRAILISGWGGLQRTQLSPSIYQTEFVPYDWLGPRVAAMVHHGGAGTTTLVAREGIPSLVVPFGYDQGFWGERLAAFGAGLPPIPISQLTPNRLAEAVNRLVEDQNIRDRALVLGEKIRHESGIANAINIIDETLAASKGAGKKAAWI